MIRQNIERLVRSRPVRISLAVALIGLGIWAFLPHVTYRIGTSAFVNAELMHVTAPIAGRLSPDLPRKGDFIDHQRSVALVETLSPDRRHLLDLEQQQSVAAKRADLASRQLAEVKDLDRDLAERMQSYRDGMIQRLGHEIGEVEAETTGCQAEARQRNDVGSRMQQLAQLGISSQIRSAEALASREATSTRCQMADARLKRLNAELTSAQNGVFLRDGTNDVPYSQQQRDRLVLRRQELESEALQNSSRSTQLDGEISEERSRLERLGHYDLSLPRNHVVWSVAASPGATITEGQTVFDLADCTHRFIAVELPEREFERIQAGDQAYVRLIGSEDWKTGQVRQIRGSAARVDDRLLAARVPNPDPDSITVEIALPSDETANDRNGFCDVGRLAEVRFQRASSGIVEMVSKKLQWLIAWFDRKWVNA